MNAALPSVAVARAANVAGVPFDASVSTEASTGAAAAVASKDDTSSRALGIGYFIDSLRCKEAIAAVARGAPSITTSSATPAAKVICTLANAFRVGALSPEDTRKVDQQVVARTSRFQADAETRVPDTSAKARKPRPAPRRGPSSRCSGAPVSRLAATFGGRRRGA